MLRAKYGLRGEASHSAMTRRRSSPGLRSGSSPPRNFGFTFFLVRKCCDSPPLLLKTMTSCGSSVFLRPIWAKKALKP